MDKLHSTASNPSPLEEMFLQLKTSIEKFLYGNSEFQEDMNWNLMELSVPMNQPYDGEDHQTPYIDSALHHVGLTRLSLYQPIRASIAAALGYDVCKHHTFGMDPNDGRVLTIKYGRAGLMMTVDEVEHCVWDEIGRT